MKKRADKQNKQKIIVKYGYYNPYNLQISTTDLSLYIQSIFTTEGVSGEGQGLMMHLQGSSHARKVNLGSSPEASREYMVQMYSQLLIATHPLTALKPCVVSLSCPQM